MQRKWTEEQLVEAVKESISYSDVTRKLGISAGSGGAIANIKPHIERLELDISHWYSDEEYRTATTKRCGTCKNFKPFDNFFKSNKSKDGLAGQCKDCKRLKQREWNWAKSHGMTTEQYEELLIKQNRACAICEQSPNGGRWDRLYVDHNHDTGKVRGLLCSNCNIALGNFRDNINLLKAAIKYIEHQ